jgi:hypothetical protein
MRVKKDKSLSQVRTESKAIAKQFVDLTVGQGLSQSEAAIALGNPTALESTPVQAEIQRLLRQQDLTNEQINRLLTAKAVETMLTADRASDQLKAAELLAKKKEVGWAPSEKININIALLKERETLLAEVLDFTGYESKGEIITAEFEEPSEAEEGEANE